MSISSDVKRELDRANHASKQADDIWLRKYQRKSTGDTGYAGDKPDNTGLEPSPVNRGHTGDTGDAQYVNASLPKHFRLNGAGVWYDPPATPDKKEPPDSVWVSTPLSVTALTRDADGEAWGRLLEFRDPDGVLHRWPCPMELLAGDGADFRRILMSQGLGIAPSAKARHLLAVYVQLSEVSSRAVCTSKTGWHGDTYVMPDATYGESDEHVLLQVLGQPPKMRQAGSVEGWRDNVAALCVNNSRLTLAVSAAFASPLLRVAEQESGGINIVGSSSTGKTTALLAASSVWGGSDYLHHWRTTTNGLEGLAQGHNDGLLVLDELAQIDPRQAGESAYLLANGTGKHRARRDGQVRQAASWRLLFMSAGEIGLSEHMAAAGKRSRAGQEVRLADIPADAGVGHGAFDELHGSESGAALADRLHSACTQHYGTPIRAYLTEVARMPRATLKERVNVLVSDFTAEALPKGADGQAQRVCARFGLIAAGGELASQLGLTGWPQGEAIRAAETCFEAWLNRRGGAGSQEEARALEQVQHFIEANGEARFTDLDTSDDRPTVNRAGYRRTVSGEVHYLVMPEVFKRDICAGMDHRFVARTLKDHGLLVTQEADRLTYKPRDLGRVYLIRERTDDEN